MAAPGFSLTSDWASRISKIRSALAAACEIDIMIIPSIVIGNMATIR